MIDKLKELSPLQKPHYSWQIDKSYFRVDKKDDPVFNEIIRVCKAFTIWDFFDDEMLKVAMELKERHGCKVGFLTSPYHRTWDYGDKPGVWSKDSFKEINRYIEKCETIKEAGLKIDFVQFDSEKFKIRADDPEHNQHMVNRYDMFYDVAKEYFNCPVEWYACGGTLKGRYKEGNSNYPHHLKEQKKDAISAPFYMPHETDRMLESIKLNADRCAEWGVENFNIWIALGAGYTRLTTGGHKWNPVFDYPLEASWTMGLHLNNPWFLGKLDKYEGYDKIGQPMFYPQPLKSDIWLKHFIAYVRGAHVKRDISDLEEL